MRYCAVVGEGGSEDPDRAQEVKLALAAWSTDRLVLAVLDDSELPAGLGDLPAFNLPADRQRTIDAIVERARELKSAKPRVFAGAKSTPSLTKSRRLALVMIGIVAMLVLAVIGIGSLYRTTAPAPGATPPPSPSRPLEKTLIPTGVWPWGIIGGGALLLSIGLVVGVRFRLARKRIPVRKGPIAAAGEPGPHQVFISYSRQDTGSVDRIIEHIEGAGYTVWIDREAGGHGAQRYAAPIVRAIKSARLIALMCSRHAFASDHVVREVYVAGDFRKPFLAFQLRSTQFPDRLDLFRAFRAFRPTRSSRSNWEEIKRYVS